MVASAKKTKEIHNDYTDFFSEIGCFKGTLILKVKEGAKLYQVSLHGICIPRTIQERVIMPATTANN